MNGPIGVGMAAQQHRKHLQTGVCGQHVEHASLEGLHQPSRLRSVKPLQQILKV